jgi:tRNA U54 and U55 pseudouridine synthase Pus10
VEIASFGEHAEKDPPKDGPRPPAQADRFSLDIHAAAGTYIKELVSGDDGRTQPSFAGLLGVPMRVEALDVVGVGDPFVTG